MIRHESCDREAVLSQGKQKKRKGKTSPSQRLPSTHAARCVAMTALCKPDSQTYRWSETEVSAPVAWKLNETENKKMTKETRDVPEQRRVVNVWTEP